MDAQTRSLVLYCSCGVALGVVATLATQSLLSSPPAPRQRRRSSVFRPAFLTTDEEAAPREQIARGLEDCIGNTPLIHLKSLSDATGCEILGKAEVRAFPVPDGQQLTEGWMHSSSLLAVR